MENEISEIKLKKYFEVTGKALEKAKKHIHKKAKKEAEIILDMAERYYKDADYFRKQGNYVNAFGALNYAHGWLDTGSKLGIFDIKDNKLFVVK
ncbi:DUF357 domain-containing protein [Candidatus Pacearchaeota archaeon CG_4_9_14_3_um_filter_31_7]|nr:MAG: hypothetical protein AUJ10_04145 [Candidatus Pacearchaeota archaeon CG1_02_31_27]PIN91908.1 MAG: DUF357 domain-containing protein [Candidatus Pacearchaeota archaeon CG10_big_fil_rev_8_21_14_0_10_31_59]PIZ80467.1 MAG: DUF357 domain-containing protein [Candidatus Pacearchaeota archaeon CG_4_10_14_0_2_um_filter_31_10]PJA70780.1 MAG: DUF357 domain-containing protein [Candidatus Pacearchaeota archaeon CG_4_9_14_3_um_filter_31_7]